MSEAVKLQGRQIPLKERQAIEAYKKNHLPQQQEAFYAAFGEKPQIEFDWETLSAPDAIGYFHDAMEKTIFNTLTEAFKEVCSDDLGRQAVKNSVKKIVVTNQRKSYLGDGAFTLKDGVLTYDIDPLVNIDYWEEKKKCLVEFFGNNL